MILVGPLRLKIFYDSVICTERAGGAGGQQVEHEQQCNLAAMEVHHILGYVSGSVTNWLQEK